MTANPDILYFVECNYGAKIGRAWIERDANTATMKHLMDDLALGQLDTPIVRIIAVSADVRVAADVTKIFGDALFDYFNNYVAEPFSAAPDNARDLMMRAGHDIDAIDTENEENDNIFALAKMEPL